MAENNPMLLAFDDIFRGPFQQFLQLSRQIGDDVSNQAKMVEEAMNELRRFLSLAPHCKAPDTNQLTELLKPLADKVSAIQTFREKNRASKFINHLSAVSESSPAFFWVSVTPTPGPYVKEMSDAGQFYSNRVLVEYKEKDKTHVEWAKSLVLIFTAMQQFIKQHHTTGVSWNPRGGNVADAKSGRPASGGRAPPPPPGPPPPPPPSFEELSALVQNVSVDNRAALFEQLNRGDDVTKGLRKVTSDQQTHKNPNLRTQPGIEPKHSFGASHPGKANVVVAKPPKLELQGKKWVVEHHKGNKNIVIDDTSMNQSVYVYACEDCVIQVKGKLNSIVLDACKKSSLVFDNIVSSVEFVNCQRIQAQGMGVVPTVMIDKTDGIQFYLSKESLTAEVVTSKSSEMNLLIPNASGEYDEFPVPEQFKTQWNGKGITTTVVEQA
ncbi:hypothetical protein CHUAL_002376 [Chamberlinius hualienensis]